MYHAPDLVSIFMASMHSCTFAVRKIRPRIMAEEYIDRQGGPSRCKDGLFFPTPAMAGDRIDPANDF